MAVTNDISLALNNKMLSVLPGDEVVYEAMDKIMSDDSQDQLTYSEEFLNSLTPTGMPPHKLHLNNLHTNYIYHHVIEKLGSISRIV